VVDAASSEVGTGREGYEEVPVLVKDIEDIALVVWAWGKGGEDVAGECVMAFGEEGISDEAAEFAGYEDVHGVILAKAEGKAEVIAAWAAVKSGGNHRKSGGKKRRMKC